MTTLPPGAWWRSSRQGTLGQVITGAVIGPTRLIIVGEDSGSPIIYTALAADLRELTPTYSQETPAGSDPLRGVDYTADISEAVAVGDNGSVETSGNEGLSWSAQTLAGSPDLSDVVAVSGATSRFVAVAPGEIWGRDAAGTWTTRWTGANTFYSVAYRAGAGWVASGLSGWTTQSPTAANGSFIAPYQIAPGDITRIRANNSYFIAVGDGGKIWRSATGLSGSWTDISLTETFNLDYISPTAADNGWAISSLNRTWYSQDNGTTWVYAGDRAYSVSPMTTNNDVTIAGSNAFGWTWVSYEQFQADYFTTVTGDAPPAFSPNADMAGDAVRRLVTQFRSGRG